MRDQLKAFAPYISVFGLVLLAAGFFAPTLVQQSGAAAPAWLGTALLVAGAVLALAWPILRPEDVRAAVGTRQVRYGGNALVLVAAVVAILIALNFLSTRRYRAWDLTTNKQYSLSRQSIQLVENLPEPVALTAIIGADNRQAADDLERLVDQYRQRSDKITYQHLDPQVDYAATLALAGRLGVDPSTLGQSLIAESGGRRATVYSFDEQSVTEVIVKATRTDAKRVVFITGHGEQDITAAGQTGRGYSGVKSGLEREGYTVASQSLSTVTGTLQADAVVVAGPQRPFLAAEAEMLADFVAGGGSALLMLDPQIDAGLDTVLQPWGIQPHGDLVLKATALFGQVQVAPVVPVVGPEYQFHTITKDMATFTSAFPNTQSLGVGTPVTTALQVTKLIEVGQAGAPDVWGEKDFEALAENKAVPDPTDEQAPLTLAIAAEGGESAGRLVVFGTSNLASDLSLQQYAGTGNGNLFLNAVNWLTADEDLISIRPTEPDSRPVSLPQSPALLLVVTALLVPLAIFGVAVWLWWRRR